ncbi:hypothetical protein ANO11243_026540 [Dothideomycetidae sp. 11243]|nr:hypothetical protein ANO11243_026540 [fungal sp. No.11243]
MTESKPTITHATREDVPHILSLIHELAAYEHATSSVQATVDSLTATLRFAPTPTSKPTGQGSVSSAANGHDYASPTGQVVGMALYFTNYSTWTGAPGVYLEDLFVRPEYRGRGYGTALIRALALEARSIGGKRLEWSCLRWNEPSLKFYRSLGAVEKSDWTVLRADGEAFERLADAAAGGVGE